MPTLQLHWERHWGSRARLRTKHSEAGRSEAGRSEAGHPKPSRLPTKADLFHAVGQWQRVSPCDQVIAPGKMRKPAVCHRQALGYFRSLTGWWHTAEGAKACREAGRTVCS